MNTTSIIHELRTAIGEQLALVGQGSDLATTGEAILAMLTPQFERSLLAFAEQAVTEVQAQLPDHEVTLTMHEGQPEIRIREGSISRDTSPSMDDLHARLTLRLPEMLKSELEAAAGSAGDSINAYVIKALAGRRRGGGGPRQVKETFET